MSKILFSTPSCHVTPAWTDVALLWRHGGDCYVRKGKMRKDLVRKDRKPTIKINNFYFIISRSENFNFNLFCLCYSIAVNVERFLQLTQKKIYMFLVRNCSASSHKKNLNRTLNNYAVIFLSNRIVQR